MVQPPGQSRLRIRLHTVQHVVHPLLPAQLQSQEQRVHAYGHALALAAIPGRAQAPAEGVLRRAVGQQLQAATQPPPLSPAALQKQLKQASSHSPGMGNSLTISMDYVNMYE